MKHSYPSWAVSEEVIPSHGKYQTMMIPWVSKTVREIQSQCIFAIYSIWIEQISKPFNSLCLRFKLSKAAVIFGLIEMKYSTFWCHTNFMLFILIFHPKLCNCKTFLSDLSLSTGGLWSRKCMGDGRLRNLDFCSYNTQGGLLSLCQ